MINFGENVIELNHPLVEHKLGILRRKQTGTKEFREIINEIGMFLCYKAMEDAELEVFQNWMNRQFPMGMSDMSYLFYKNIFIVVL